MKIVVDEMPKNFESTYIDMIHDKHPRNIVNMRIAMMQR